MRQLRSCEGHKRRKDLRQGAFYLFCRWCVSLDVSAVPDRSQIEPSLILIYCRDAFPDIAHKDEDRGEAEGEGRHRGGAPAHEGAGRRQGGTLGWGHVPFSS